jgi:glutamate-1-semialdehyde 2,1-aminomutase
LEALVAEHDIGVIKMEVMRNLEPDDDFLQKVRQLATREGIVLIFDECTSGFRQTLGGLHKQYGVDPDIAVFGKAIGNGYALTAVIGRREIMEHAQSTFISSTFWTERVGPTAGVKTLEIMERTRSYDQITATGREIGKGWQQLAAKHRLPLRLSGLPALISFNIDSPNMRAYKTLITQEMLEKGFLAGTSVYACTEHTPELVNQYIDLLDPIFGIISECEAGRPVTELLKGPICDSGFGRLN